MDNGIGNGINGCGSNVNGQQFSQKQMQQQKNQSLCSEVRHINGVGDKTFDPAMSHPQVLPAQIDHRAREIDQYICLQVRISSEIVLDQCFFFFLAGCCVLGIGNNLFLGVFMRVGIRAQ